MMQQEEYQATAHNAVNYRNELLRKSIHMCSLSIPVTYYFLTKQELLTMLVPLTALFLAGDLLRLFHAPSFRLYERIFGHMLRKHEKTAEKKTLNGASWVLITATLCVIAFPKIITITAFSILIISDTTAALIGRRYGTRRYRDKSLEGSTAFVLSAWIVILLTPKVAFLPGEYVIAGVAAIVGAVSEVFSFGIIDDNFAIPVSISLVLWLLYIVFFPQLNVFILEI